MRKKFAWFFCIFMSSLVLLSCSEDNKKGEEPGDGTGGGTPEGDTKTYFETTYSDLSAYVDKNVSEIWAAVEMLRKMRKIISCMCRIKKAIDTKRRLNSMER